MLLRKLVSFSLAQRGIVLSFACAIVAYGVYTALHAKLDVFPEFSAPQVVIQTEAPGFTPEQVEHLVTRPIEGVLSGTDGLESIRSKSIQGLSAVTAVFSKDADIYRVRQSVREHLLEIPRRLPAGVETPTVGTLTSSTSLVLAIGLTSSKLSQTELRTIADWQIRPQILGIPGVGNMEAFGGEVRQLQIQVHPAKLLAYDLSLTDVVDSARQALVVHGAGFAETPSQRVAVHMQSQAMTPENLGSLVVGRSAGSVVRFSDVAEVVDGPEPRVGAALIQGEEGVLLLAHAQYQANTLEVTAAIERVLDTMRPGLLRSGVELHSSLFRPASFIQKSLENVRTSLFLGGCLVVAVLYFFLRDLRTAFISFTAIPISLLGAATALDAFGISINTLTLGGLAIAVGVVVDDAIIDVENTVRRLREFSETPSGETRRKSKFQIILDASIEVRSAVVYATFIVALVFLPILTMPGVQGSLFAPLASAFILATLISLLVALSITPALCLTLLRNHPPRALPGSVQALARFHRRLLRYVLAHPGSTLLGPLVLVLLAVVALPFFGGEFLPEFREGHLIIHTTSVPGTSLLESIRLGRAVASDLLQNGHIRSIAQQIGRAENGEDTWGVNLSEYHVELAEMTGEEADKVVEEIRSTLSKFPAFTFDVMPFLAERIEETLTGTNAQFVVEIFGEDLDALDRKADEVRRTIRGTAGAVDVQVESQPTAPEFAVDLRLDQVRRYGFSPADIVQDLQSVYEGIHVGQIFDAERVSDVFIRLFGTDSQDPEMLGNMLIAGPDGMRVPLRELATLGNRTSRSLIVHHQLRRHQQVTCNVRGRDVASFLADAQDRLRSEVPIPDTMTMKLSGSAVAQGSARGDLLVRSMLAAVGIVLLLAMVFHRLRNLLLVLANLPFALAGGVLAVAVSGGDISLGTLVGFVALFGITMRNSIMLISHYEHLVQREGRDWNVETAIEGASERMIPVLMTALVTALGLLPIALSFGEAGHEIEAPMAIVILGGLASSTILNLLVLPAAAIRFGVFEQLEDEDAL